jgi:hypothetical protein
MTAPIPLDDRARAARDFALKALQLDDATFAPASADASFRRYFRVQASGQSWVVMDAPTEREDCRPFIWVSELMAGAGVHAPKVLAQDLSQGFLLLTDLGCQTLLHVINEANADAYFSDAIDALLRWQLASRPELLPEYDRALLERELSLFPDWYVARHLNHVMDFDQCSAWQASCALLTQRALAQAKVFVHRDYMPRNLMVASPNPGVLDYQDAVYGPISYDVVSLFKDAFLSWPEARVAQWRHQYWAKALAAGLPVPGDEAVFNQDFDYMGLQRHLKVLGIFARIHYRDGKPHYLADAPRFIRYVRTVAGRYAELAPLITLFDSLGLPSE